MHAPCKIVMHFQMQMRGLRRTRIATKRNEISLCHRQLTGTKSESTYALLLNILMFPQLRYYARRKTLEVAINACIAFRMMDVKCISKTEKPNGNLTDISIANGIKCLAFHLTGLDVYPTMKMIRAWLGKVAGQLNVIMDR